MGGSWEPGSTAWIVEKTGTVAQITKSGVFRNDTQHMAGTAWWRRDRQMSRNLGKRWRSQIAKGHESQCGISGLVLWKGSQSSFLPTLTRTPDEAWLPVLGTLPEDLCEEQLWEPCKTDQCLHTPEGRAGEEKRLFLWGASKCRAQTKWTRRRQLCTALRCIDLEGSSGSQTPQGRLLQGTCKQVLSAEIGFEPGWCGAQVQGQVSTH